MSFGFGFALPAYPLRGGGGNNPFNQLGPTLDLSFAGVVTDQSDPNGYTLNTNFIIPQYQIAAQYVVWETGVGLVDKTFSQIITFTRASTGTFFDSAGVLTSAAIDAPRFDYNPSTLVAQGLLIEEARTNLCLQSEDFATTWAVAGTATITTNQLTSPAGTLTADLLTTPTGGPNRVQQFGTAVVSTTYAVSVFVKAGDINGLTFRLFFSGGTSVDTYADFIFSSATFSGVIGAGIFSAQNCGNGWFRITCVIASGNNTTWDMRIGGLIGTAQTGTTAYVWGGQFEAGAFPTSYIPTTTTALTRSADVASVNTLSPWYNATEGTLYTESVVARVPSIAGTGIAQFDDGTSSNRIRSFYRAIGTTGSQITLAGSAVVDLTPTGALTANQNLKLGFAYKTNDFAASGNGAAAVTSGSGALPTVNRMLLGNSDQYINGYLRRITYYPRRLTADELRQITLPTGATITTQDYSFESNFTGNTVAIGS
jgi:hypothetical protein